MAGACASFLLAYAIEISSIFGASRSRGSLQQSTIGSVVSIAASGLLSMFAFLYLSARLNAGGWGWPEDLLFAFAFASLALLGMCIVLLPYVRYEWERQARIGPPDDD
jgi:hypothetical protein